MMTAGGVDGKTPLGQEGLDPTLQLYNRRMAQRRHVFAQSAIRRERLSHEAHQGAKALVYCAPSGFGKSTQLAIMAEDAGSGNAAYLSLAELEKAEGIEKGIVAILKDCPTNLFHGATIFLFSQLISELAHVFHVKFLLSFSVYSPGDVRKLTRL